MIPGRRHHLAFNRFAFLVLLCLSTAGFADGPVRPRMEGKIVLKLQSVPQPGARGWAEYGRFLQLHPDITLQSATGIKVEGLAEAQLFLAMAADLAPDVFSGSLRDVQTFYHQRFLHPLDEFYARDKAALPPIQENVQSEVYQDGKLIAMPFFYKVMALLHRPRIMEMVNRAVASPSSPESLPGQTGETFAAAHVRPCWVFDLRNSRIFPWIGHMMPTPENTSPRMAPSRHQVP